jgi:CYTH domain-containing protein
MALEIERRFLIKNDHWKKFIINKTSIEQGYLSYNLEDWIIRIRFNGKDFKIALKKHIQNFTNYEYEFSIPNSEGEKIMATLTNKIKKERFFLEVDNKNWIVDCFKDKNFPLEIAEIELNSEKEEVILPPFVSREITGLKIFTNLSLTKRPFSKWENKDLKKFK